MRQRIDTPDQWATFSAAVLRRLDRYGKPLSASIEDYVKPKTPPQLAKIHAMCAKFGISQGYQLEDIKVILKFHLGYTRFIEKKDGTTLEVVRSFGAATREQMSSLIDRLYALAIEYGIELDD